MALRCIDLQIRSPQIHLGIVSTVPERTHGLLDQNQRVSHIESAHSYTNTTNNWYYSSPLWWIGQTRVDNRVSLDRVRDNARAQCVHGALTCRSASIKVCVSRIASQPIKYIWACDTRDSANCVNVFVLESRASDTHINTCLHWCRMIRILTMNAQRRWRRRANTIMCWINTADFACINSCRYAPEHAANLIIYRPNFTSADKKLPIKRWCGALKSAECAHNYPCLVWHGGLVYYIRWPGIIICGRPLFPAYSKIGKFAQNSHNF